MSATDATPGAGTPVGSRDLTALAAGATSTVATSLTVPATLTPGAYFLSAIADSNGAVVELDETNNGLTASTALGVTLYEPDLVVMAVTVPANGATSRPLTITNTVRNQGPAPAGVFRITFYMSATDPTPGAGTAVGFRDLTTLATGASSPASTVVTIPATLTPGPYYVSAVADSGGLQVELDEGNNGLTASRQITVTPYQPDLVMTAVTIPARGAVGRPLTVTNTVRNQGPAPAGAFRITFYISATDPTPGAGVAVGLREVPALGPAVSSPAVTVVTIPATLTPGIYYFSAVADSAGTQIELDETNNGFTASSQVKVTLYEPDLVMSALRAPSSGAVGRPFTLTHTVTNQGPAPAGPFWITFYMSATDPTPGAGMPVWVYVVTGLGAGANLTASTAITVPEMLAPGSYFVSAIA